MPTICFSSIVDNISSVREAAAKLSEQRILPRGSTYPGWR